MEKHFVFAGFGGQGILTTGLIIAHIGAMQDKEVTWIPSYGAEMRGGTANCTVKISDELIGSPFVKKIDILVAMNQPSIDKFLPQMKDDGIILVNSSIVKDVPRKGDIRVVEIPATEVCEKISYSRGTNICIIGALAACTDLFGKECYEEGIKHYFAKKPQFHESNLAAFQAGYDYVAKE